MVQQSVWGSNVWIDVCIVSLLNSKWSTVRLWPVHCEQTSYECVSGVFCIKPWGCCLSSCATYYHMTESFRSYEPFPNLTCNSYPPQHHWQMIFLRPKQFGLCFWVPVRRLPSAACWASTTAPFTLDKNPTNIWLLSSTWKGTTDNYFRVKWLCGSNGCWSALGHIGSNGNMTPRWTCSF